MLRTQNNQFQRLNSQLENIIYPSSQASKPFFNGLTEQPKASQSTMRAPIQTLQNGMDCDYHKRDILDGPTDHFKSKPPIAVPERDREQMFLDMKSEENRLRTFQRGWSVVHMKPSDLAKAGFFYLQFKDKVQCAFCRGIVSEWALGDRPMREHAKYYPLCPFLLGCDVGNVSMEESDDFHVQSDQCGSGVSIPKESLIYKPLHPEMADYEKRVQTFIGWPLTTLQPTQLSEAGLYYTGVADVVTCFFCNGSLGNWDIGDEPWSEHSKFFPKCTFLKLARSASNGANHSANNVQEQEIPVDIIEMPSGSSNVQESEENAAEICQSPQASAVMYRKCNGTKEELQELCENLAHMKSETSESATSESFKILEDSNEGSERTKKDILLCKICMDQEMGMVFIPCGHLLACKKCSEIVSVCPLCRTPITATVRAYMS